MAFNAGSIEATLTLNRNPFTEGLKAAKAQAQKAAGEKHEMKLDVKLDQVQFNAVKRQMETLSKSLTNNLKVTLDQNSVARVRSQMERIIGNATVRAQLNRETLTAVQAQINRTVGRIGINARLNRDTLTAVRTQINNASGSIGVRATLNRESLTAVREQVNRAVGSINVRARLDADSLTAIRARLERMVGYINVRLRLDRDSLAELRARIAAMSFQASLNLDTDTDGAAMANIATHLANIRNEAGTAQQAVRNFGNESDGAFRRADGAMRLFIAGMPLILPALGSAIVGATGLIGGLISILGIAGFAIGSLALVGKPVFDAIKDGAALSYAEIAKLPDGIRQGAMALKGLQEIYAELVKSVQVPVGNMMAQAFGAAMSAIRPLQPLIAASATAFGELFKQANLYFTSPMWTGFVGFLTSQVGPVVNGLGQIFGYLMQAVMNTIVAFQPLVQWLLPLMVQGMKDLADWTGNFTKSESFTKFLAQVKESLPAVMGFILRLIEFLFNLSMALAPIGDMVLNAFSGFLDFLNKMPPELLSGIAMGVAAIMAAMLLGAGGGVAAAVGAVVGLGAAFVSLYDSSLPLRQLISYISDDMSRRLGPVFEYLAGVARDVLIPVFERIQTTFEDKVLPAFKRLYDAVAPVIEWLVENLGGVLIFVIQNLALVFDGALTTIAGLFDIFASLFNGNWDDFWNGLKNVAEGVLQMILGIFGIKLEDFYSTISGWWTSISEGWTSFWNDLGRVFSDWWNRISTEWNNFWTVVSTIWNEFWTNFSNSWNEFWSGIGQFFTDWWNGIVQEWNNFWTAIGILWDQWWNNFNTSWNNFWNGIYNWAVGVWNNITTAWNNFWAGVRAVYDTVSNAIGQAWNNFWTDVENTAKRIWDNIKGGWETFTNWLRDRTQEAAEAIGRVWRSVANFFRDPINWVIRVVLNDGVLKAWNTVMGWIGAPGLQAGGIPEIPAFAEGGKIVGPGSGKSDSILAMVSNGEYVIPEAVARKHYHFLEQLRMGQPEAVQAAGGGNDPNPFPRYAAGGLVAAQQFAQSMNGKPYIWGGGTTAGTDCSGYQGMITNVLRGNAPARIGTTANFPWPGFAPGLNGAYAVGSTPNAGGGIGHMAGTLAGVNVESGGSHGNVAYGGPAAGADAGLFTTRAYLPEVGGVFASGGGGGPVEEPVSWWSIVKDKVIEMIKAALNFVGIPTPDGLPAKAGIGAATKIGDEILAQLERRLSELMELPSKIMGAIGQLATTVIDNNAARPGYRPYGYDSGGWLMPGQTVVQNDTGKPEAVLTQDQWRSMISGGQLAAGPNGAIVEAPVLNATMEGIDKLDSTMTEVKDLLERRGAGATVNINGGNQNSKETAREAVLALRLS